MHHSEVISMLDYDIIIDGRTRIEICDPRVVLRPNLIAHPIVESSLIVQALT